MHGLIREVIVREFGDHLPAIEAALCGNIELDELGLLGTQIVQARIASIGLPP